MTRETVHNQSVEKQMGCMAGFLQIFDRHSLLAGKRIYAMKRLPSSSPSADSSTQSEKSVPAFCKEEEQKQKQQPEEILVKPVLEIVNTLPSPEKPALVEISDKLPVFELNEFKEACRSSWKFRESPRLSLDSRASVDGKGSLYPKQIKTNAAILSANAAESATDDENEQKLRSPSVIARLMGLEALPEATREPRKKPELRRSNSESRSRDLVQCRHTDGHNAGVEDKRVANLVEYCGRKQKSEPVKVQNGGFGGKPQKQTKNYFDSEDFFPEPKQTGSLYGEIEKRLKMRGIDEPEKDLEALKQILEALQLKGLLRSRRATDRNFVFDRSRSFSSEETQIVVMKSRSPRRYGSNSPPPTNLRSKHLTGESLPSPVRPRRDRSEIVRSPRARNSMSPDRSCDSNARSPSSLARRKSLEKKGNDSVEQRRSSPVHSPRINTRKIGTGSEKSPRNSVKSSGEISPKQRISRVIEDESSSVSECSISTMDTERPNYREGKTLLARCDKLLNGIAEITTTTESQPSPVSVLDASFYHEESSLSPIKKRCIDFKDQSVDLEEEDDKCSQAISPVRLRSDDCDYVYVSEILQASISQPEETDLFFLLEKQQYESNSSNVSRLHRKLVFDTITEIVDRKKQLAPWETVSTTNPTTGKPSFRQIWLEYSKIRDRKNVSGDLFEVICGVLEKDMAGDSVEGWSDCAPVTSELVLDIERMIFKDLVGETIRDLATLCGERMARRKLVF